MSITPAKLWGSWAGALPGSSLAFALGVWAITFPLASLQAHRGHLVATPGHLQSVLDEAPPFALVEVQGNHVGSFVLRQPLCLVGAPDASLVSVGDTGVPVSPEQGILVDDGQAPEAATLLIDGPSIAEAMKGASRPAGWPDHGPTVVLRHLVLADRRSGGARFGSATLRVNKADLWAEDVVVSGRRSAALVTGGQARWMRSGFQGALVGGLVASDQARVVARACLAVGNGSAGFTSLRGAKLNLQQCQSHGNGATQVYATDGGQVAWGGSRVQGLRLEGPTQSQVTWGQALVALANSQAAPPAPKPECISRGEKGEVLAW